MPAVYPTQCMDCHWSLTGSVAVSLWCRSIEINGEQLAMRYSETSSQQYSPMKPTSIMARGTGTAQANEIVNTTGPAPQQLERV
jgi:hypothetical protein